MAIQNDPRLYSGGSAVVNLQPHVALYANLLARKAARKDAFDEYMRNLNKGINSAGMRTQERAPFDDKLAKWQQFGIDHANEIRKRQNGADIKFMNDYQDLQNLVSESKTEEEKKKPFVEMYLDPNKRDRLNNDATIEAVHGHDQPIFMQDDKGDWVRNPNRKSIDYTDVAFNPKPFEQDKYFKQFEDVKRSDLTPNVVKNPKDMTQTVTTTSVFDKDAKDLIATRAVSDYMSNSSFKDFIGKLKPEDYNDFYKQNYGKDISSPADLAAAYTLKGMQQKMSTSKYEPDTYARQLDLQKRSQGFQAWMHKQPTYKDSQGSEEDKTNTWIDGYVDEIKKKAIAGNDRRTLTYNGKEIHGVRVPLDETVANVLGINEKSKGEVILADGKFYKLPYRTDDKYEPIADEKSKGYKVDKNLVREMDDESLKLALGKTAGVKQKNLEMNAGKKEAAKFPLPKGKPQTVKQNGYTYTWNEATGQYE